MFFQKSLVVAILSIVSMMVCATSTQAQQNYFAPAKTQDVFNHFVQPGESCELIARKYYLVEDASLLLAENPWLANRPLWGRNGVISYRIHPGEVIRIKLGQQPTYFQSQQPIQVVENSFMNSPVFWIAVGFFFVMLIALSIIIGILWGGGRRGYYAVQGNAPHGMHHTHDHNHAGVVEVQYSSNPGGTPVAPIAPADGGGGPQNEGARSPVGFKKADAECGQGKD